MTFFLNILIFLYFFGLFDIMLCTNAALSYWVHRFLLLFLWFRLSSH